MSGRQGDARATSVPAAAEAIAGGAPLVAHGEAPRASKMCKMFNMVQGGGEMRTTFNSQGVEQAMAARLEASKATESA